MRVLTSIISSVVHTYSEKDAGGSKGGEKNIILFPGDTDRASIFPGGSIDDYLIDFPR